MFFKSGNRVVTRRLKPAVEKDARAAHRAGCDFELTRVNNHFYSVECQTPDGQRFSQTACDETVDDAMDNILDKAWKVVFG